MSKKLEIYERFLLAIALTGDMLFDIYKEGGAIGRQRHFYDPWGPPNYNPSNLYRTFNYMLKTGYIEKVIKNGKPYLRLTSRANEKLKRDFPIFKMQKRKWDSHWRLVIFDIKEKSREIRKALRNKLRELGFGMFQKSIYISPYNFTDDMYEFLKNQRLLGQAFVLTAKHELMGDARDLARFVWKLDKLEEEYEELWLQIVDIEEVKNREKAIREIKDQYLKIIQKDPCLPYDLLPEDWPADEVRKAVVKL